MIFCSIRIFVSFVNVDGVLVVDSACSVAMWYVVDLHGDLHLELCRIIFYPSA